RTLRSFGPGGGGPNPTRWALLADEERSGSVTDAAYATMRDHGLPLVRGVIDGLFVEGALDAIVYPTSPRRPALAAGGGGGGLDLAGGLHWRPFAGPDLVLRKGVQRTRAAGPGVCVRTGYEGAARSAARAPLAGGTGADPSLRSRPGGHERGG